MSKNPTVVRQGLVSEIDDELESRPFKPHAWLHEGLDQIMVFYKSHSYSSRPRTTYFGFSLHTKNHCFVIPYEWHDGSAGYSRQVIAKVGVKLNAIISRYLIVGVTVNAVPGSGVREFIDDFSERSLVVNRSETAWDVVKIAISEEQPQLNFYEKLMLRRITSQVVLAGSFDTIGSSPL